MIAPRNADDDAEPKIARLQTAGWTPSVVHPAGSDPDGGDLRRAIDRPVIEVPNPPNTAAQQAKHYVVLVSLDGFRYDYATKYGAKNLLAMAARGASAPDGMIPSYPSVTFPNHYTIVTGLYPDHHGIVANTFYDPARKETYSLTDPKTTGDGSWYGGTPLWVLAEQQGMRAACFFWPSSDAEIQGKRPSYYLLLTTTNFPTRNASSRFSRGCSFRRKRGPISSRFTSRIRMTPATPTVRTRRRQPRPSGTSTK